MCPPVPEFGLAFKWLLPRRIIKISSELIRLGGEIVARFRGLPGAALGTFFLVRAQEKMEAAGVACPERSPRAELRETRDQSLFLAVAPALELCFTPAGRT